MTQSLAGMILYSPDPEKLCAFYRHAIGIPLAPADHGTVGEHVEGMLAGVHFAVWPERAGHGAGPLVPVFRVADLDAAGSAVEAAGGKRLHKVIDLGDGKRVSGFRDPDGRALRLIHLG